MAYGYLLAPSFQFVNINGRPLVGGHIEVFIHNTDTKYITKADFDGTDNPFKVPLNSKGMAVIIASGDFTYDVFCYDRFGSLFWSGSDVAIDNSSGLVIEGAELPMRIVGGKITNNGKELTCTGENAWAEGAETTASGANAHAEGGQTTASGEHSHSEGFRTTASSGYCHAEGAGSKASNTASHAEGQDTTSSGQASHAEGRGSEASGDYSHASGRGTRATGEGSTAVGKWNDDGDALFVVGGGTASNNRKDVFKVDRNGDTWVLVNNSLVRVNNFSQFVLTRSNMTTAFTNDEYSDCVNSVTNGVAVCVQLGTSLQLQLTQISSLGIHFEATFGDYHYTYVVAPTANAHTISENIRHFGTPIYATLQDAISDADALHVGMYFETNGFHTSGDGGAARYRVSSTGTANGKDVIALDGAGTKYAILQHNDSICPEQLGYVYSDTSVDVVPYITRIIQMGIHEICLPRRYRWKTTLTITTQGLIFKGLSEETSPSSSLLNFLPSTGVTKMIELRTKCVEFSNLYFYNGSENPTDQIAIECDNLNSNANNYKWQFSYLKFVSFHIGVRLNCNLPWHITFDSVQFGFCNYGFISECNITALQFNNVYCNGCYECGISIRGMCQGLIFNQCNFGSQKTGVSFEKYGLFDNMEASFNGCNFEIDTNAPIDNTYKKLFVNVDNDVYVSLVFIACNFVLTKTTLLTIPTGCRCITLGNKSTIEFISSVVEATGSVNTQLINEGRSPMDKVGSIRIDASSLFFAKPDYGLLKKYYVVESKDEYNDNLITKVYDLTNGDPATLDANSIIPDSSGKEIISEVNTFSGTTNLPSGFSGAGILHSCTFNAYTRCIQYFFATDGNCYTRRAIRNTTSDPWNWQGWKKFTSA